MGRGINIEFVANVDKFIGRTKDIEGALDDVADSLDDLAREGEKAGDKAGDSLKDGLDDATDAAKKLERKFRDAYDEVKKGSRKAGDDLGDNVKRGADKAGDGLDDVKDEAKDSAREVAASFDGSMDGVVGGVQELLANLGGLGPVGAAAGVGLAAIAGTVYTAWQEKTEKTKQLVEDMFADMIESGNTFASTQFINDQISEIVKNDDLVRVYTEAARTIGVDVTTAIRAAAGEQDAMNTVTAAASAWQEKYGATAGSTNTAVVGLTDAIAAQESAVDSAAAKYALASGAMLTTADATNAWAQAQASVVDIVGETNTALIENGKTYAGNAEVLREKNVAALNEMASQLAEVNQAAVDANVTGADLAAVQREQYDAFMAAAAGAGLARDDAEKLAETYNLVPTAVETEVSTPGVDQSRTDVQNLQGDLDGLHPVDVKVNVITPAKAELAAKMRALALEVNVPVVVGVNRAGRAVV